jgi:xylose isomerase
MARNYFPEVKGKIKYEGPDSKDPLTFKWYRAKRKVGGKTMEEHLKFAVCYWHTFKGTGGDPFGGGVYERPWDQADTPMGVAEDTVQAAFEFFKKLGVPYWCFHDRDIAPEGDSVRESAKNLNAIVQIAKKKQKETGVKLLWGTANVFSHARYVHGAGTNPDPLVFAHAAAQIRRAIDATITLGGRGYVFWGGREGYVSLINTNMKQEREQLAALLTMARDYGRKSGFKGTFFIEPKPKEPSTHQYDFDCATCLGFLTEFDLLDDFALNVEANHATLATHTFEHELLTASNAGKLGSLDINRGDMTVGWDTDQFAMDLKECTQAMLIILNQRGLRHGGLNFDAKVRRSSFDTVDLFHAHIGGMDTFARALLIADRMERDGVLSDFIKDRYKGYRSGIGRKILSGKTSLPALEAYAEKNGEPEKISGRQEMLENILNDYVHSTKIV